MAEFMGLLSSNSGGAWSGYGGFGGETSSGGIDWTKVLQSGIGAVGSYVQAKAAARAAPSYSPMMGYAAPPGGGWGGVAGGVLGGLLGGYGMEDSGMSGGVIQPSTPGVFAGGPGDLFRTSYSQFFNQGRSSLYAKRLLPIVNPMSGTVHYWRHVGTPVVFSGDLSLAKRLGKVGRKLGGGARGRCTKSRRR